MIWRNQNYASYTSTPQNPGLNKTSPPKRVGNTNKNGENDEKPYNALHFNKNAHLAEVTLVIVIIA